MTEKDIATREKTEVSHTGAEQLVDSGAAYSPDVDVYLSEDELLLAVDMPGVGKGDVHIEIDESNSLVLKAKNTAVEPGKTVLKQFQVGDYFRSFRIGDEFDKDKVSAKLENGLMEVRIPKKEAAKPRRIAINA